MRAALILAFACAAPPPTPDPVIRGVAADAAESEPPSHIIGRFLCDACTSELTTEECIAHAGFLLEHCKLSGPQCLRRACLRLGEHDSKDEDFVPIRARFRLANR